MLEDGGGKDGYLGVIEDGGGKDGYLGVLDEVKLAGRKQELLKSENMS